MPRTTPSHSFSSSGCCLRFAAFLREGLAGYPRRDTHKFRYGRVPPRIPKRRRGRRPSPSQENALVAGRQIIPSNRCRGLPKVRALPRITPAALEDAERGDVACNNRHDFRVGAIAPYLGSHICRARADGDIVHSSELLRTNRSTAYLFSAR